MLIGTVLFNRYKIVKLLGSGGFGDTYLAEDLNLPKHHQCVVKHLQLKPPNTIAALPTAKRLFKTEAEALYSLGKHDQIPTLYADFEEQGEFYLVQEFIDGEDLTKEIYPGNILPEKEVRKLLQDILEVLEVVHHQKIIHRDIKCQNIMRRRRDRKIILIDFGAVKETMTINAQGKSILTIGIGTPGYQSSEQANGRPRLCSDIYAVGMLGIYALTGIQPHDLPKDPRNDEVIWRNFVNVSEEFANILTKMVRYHFSDRYPSATEALTALKPPPKSHDPSRRGLIKAAGLVLTGVGLAVIGERLLFPEKTQKGSTEKQNDKPVYSPSPTKESSKPQNNLQKFKFEVVSTNAQGSITNRRNGEAEYFQEDLGNGVKLEMVQIPGGSFLMGSPESEKERFSFEETQHQVTVPGFFMGKYEVTQEQYEAIMGKNPSKFKGINRPVETVSWNDAVEFCQKISQKTGKNYRLPSEAEWEYACRARTTTPFYFGESITPDLVNYDGNYPYASASKAKYRQQTTEVGTFPPNAFGLYDMHGNVWEWCLDDWNENYINAPTDGSAWIRQSAEYKLLRGGSWFNLAWYCRAANRGRYSRDGRVNDCGFRVALSFRTL